MTDEGALDRISSMVPEAVFDIIGRFIPGCLALFTLLWFIDYAKNDFLAKVMQLSAMLPWLVIFLSASYASSFLLRPIGWCVECFSLKCSFKELMKLYEPIVKDLKVRYAKKSFSLNNTRELWNVYAFVHYKLKDSHRHMNSLLPKIVAEAHLCYNLSAVFMLLVIVVVAWNILCQANRVSYESLYALLPLSILAFIASFWFLKSIFKRHADYYWIYIGEEN